MALVVSCIALHPLRPITQRVTFIQISGSDKEDGKDKSFVFMLKDKAN
jgi:hypothetical protein